jgi:predicted phage terminase large subunit-like protein
VADVDIPNLDDSVAQLPQDIRADLAETGRRNLYFFAKAVLGYRQMTPACHGPLCAFFDDHPAPYKLTLMPRGTFKTSVVTIGRNAQMAVRDPNSRICIINEVADNAEGFLGTIRQHFENNRILRTLYSDIVPKDYRKTTWNNQAIRLNRQWMGPEDTIEAMGVLATLTSHHYTHIAYDDVISEDAVKSPQIMTDTIERAKKFRSLMVDPALSTLDITGTRWSLHDIYSHFMQSLPKDRLGLFIRSAIKPDGTLLFPELLNQQTLAELRNEYGEYMFSCLYLNNPRDIANQDFNVGDLKFWRWSSDEESVVLYGHDGTIEGECELSKLDITVSVDLAVSERVTSDCNAIVTVGATPDGRAIVLDTWVKRCTPLAVIERLIELRRRYNLRAVGIEGVAYQKSFKYFLQAECERQGIYMNIVELKAIPSKRGTGNNSKEMRIRGLQPVAATGRLYILPTQHELRNQLADFPLGEHDDCIDALAHQLTMWRGLLSPERMRRYQKSENELLRQVLHPDHPAFAATDPVPGTHPRDIPHPDDLGIEIPQFSNWVEHELR